MSTPRGARRIVFFAGGWSRAFVGPLFGPFCFFLFGAGPGRPKSWSLVWWNIKGKPRGKLPGRLKSHRDTTPFSFFLVLWETSEENNSLFAGFIFLSVNWWFGVVVEVEALYMEGFLGNHPI